MPFIDRAFNSNPINHGSTLFTRLNRDHSSSAAPPGQGRGRRGEGGGGKHGRNEKGVFTLKKKMALTRHPGKTKDPGSKGPKRRSGYVRYQLSHSSWQRGPNKPPPRGRVLHPFLLRTPRSERPRGSSIVVPTTPSIPHAPSAPRKFAYRETGPAESPSRGSPTADGVKIHPRRRVMRQRPATDTICGRTVVLPFPERPTQTDPAC